MSTANDVLSRLRADAGAMIADNALALGLPSRASAPAAPVNDGSFQVALGPRAKAAVMEGLHATGADEGLERTLGRMTGGAFTPAEIRTLEDRALTAANIRDTLTLRNIQEGPPVVLSGAQKDVIDRIMGQIGADAMAQRARESYRKSVDAGQIQVRR